MEDTKRRIEPFSLYDHTNIEKHLEKMALKGWMIESIGSTFWKYKKVEPQKLHFSVVYYPKTVNEGIIVSEDRQYFIDMCTSAGWEYILNKNELHIFCTEDENTPPIETDPEIQIECIHKFAKSEIIEVYSLIIVVCVFVSAIFGYEAWDEPIDTLINNSNIFWNYPITITFSVYNIISYCIWHKKAKFAAENGEFTATKKLIKIDWIPLYFSVALIYIIIRMRVRYILFTLGLIAIGIAIYKLIDITRNAINKSKVNKNRVFKNFISFLLIVAYIVTGIGTYILIPKPYDKVTVETDDALKTYEIYNDKGAPLDISDFHDISNKTISREKTFDEALFINQTEWSIYSIEKNDDLGIRYTITDIRFAPLYDRCKEELVENPLAYNYKKMDISSSDYEIYIDEDKDYNRTFFAFCNDKKIINISFGWDPSDEELIFAAQKLLNL